MQIKPNYHHLLMLVCWALNSLSCKYGNSIIFLQLFFFFPLPGKNCRGNNQVALPVRTQAFKMAFPFTIWR